MQAHLGGADQLPQRGANRAHQQQRIHLGFAPENARRNGQGKANNFVLDGEKIAVAFGPEVFQQPAQLFGAMHFRGSVRGVFGGAALLNPALPARPRSCFGPHLPGVVPCLRRPRSPS